MMNRRSEEYLAEARESALRRRVSIGNDFNFCTVSLEMMFPPTECMEIVRDVMRNRQASASEPISVPMEVSGLVRHSQHEDNMEAQTRTGRPDKQWLDVKLDGHIEYREIPQEYMEKIQNRLRDAGMDENLIPDRSSEGWVGFSTHATFVNLRPGSEPIGKGSDYVRANGKDVMWVGYHDDKVREFFKQPGMLDATAPDDSDAYARLSRLGLQNESINDLLYHKSEVARNVAMEAGKLIYACHRIGMGGVEDSLRNDQYVGGRVQIAIDTGTSSQAKYRFGLVPAIENALESSKRRNAEATLMPMKRVHTEGRFRASDYSAYIGRVKGVVGIAKSPGVAREIRYQIRDGEDFDRSTRAGQIVQRALSPLKAAHVSWGASRGVAMG